MKVQKVDVWVQSNCFILAGAVEEPKGAFYFTYLTDIFFFFFFKFQPGLLRTDPVPEEGEDVAATIGATETLSEEEQEELRRELAKVKTHSFWDFVLRTHNLICASQAHGNISSSVPGERKQHTVTCPRALALGRGNKRM